MLDPKLLDELSRRIADSVPKNLQVLQQDFERNIRVILESVLRKMHLVSRDEFEVQQAVLMRTREKLVLLEKRVCELEKQASER